MHRILFPILLGLVGCGVLISLGMWQLDRLAWKEAVLAEIDAKIDGPAVDLPKAPDPEQHRYLPVQLSGDLAEGEIHVLTAVEGEGAGYRLIVPLVLSETTILADLGFVPGEAKDTPRAKSRVTVRGNLHWPDEADRWTPDPDLGRNIWFARDVPAMAATLGAAPVLVVVSHLTGPDMGVLPQPVTSAGIPNDHLGYAITWFGLALVWAAMSVYLIRRTTRQE